MTAGVIYAITCSICELVACQHTAARAIRVPLFARGVCRIPARGVASVPAPPRDRVRPGQGRHRRRTRFGRP